MGVASTASIIAGGSTPSNIGRAETYNGSSWTEVNDLNTARQGHGGAGTSTSIYIWWIYINKCR